MLTQQIWGYYFHILLSWQKYQYLSKIGWENFSSTYRNLLSFHINLNMLSLNLGKKVYNEFFPRKITNIIEHDRAFYKLYLNDNFYEKCQYLNMYSVWGDLIGTVGDVWCHSMSPVTCNRQTQQEFNIFKNLNLLPSLMMFSQEADQKVCWRWFTVFSLWLIVVAAFY